jgi:transcriptional regulator with XRE-family HTH domain
VWRKGRSRQRAQLKSREVLALNLKRLRRDRGMSQQQLARLAGLDRSYISALERLVYSATTDTLDQLAEALSVESADLIRRQKAAAI